MRADHFKAVVTVGLTVMATLSLSACHPEATQDLSGRYTLDMSVSKDGGPVETRRMMVPAEVGAGRLFDEFSPPVMGIFILHAGGDPQRVTLEGHIVPEPGQQYEINDLAMKLNEPQALDITTPNQPGHTFHVTLKVSPPTVL